MAGLMGSLDQPHVLKHRITVDAYYRMGETGIIAPDARVELIDGEIIDMAPMGSAHASVLSMLNQRLVTVLASRAEVRCQLPIQLDQHSQPEPDIALLKPRADFYRGGHPSASDVLLVIEVADTSLEFDRSVKVPLYARHGIAEVWLVDLQNRLFTIHREPKDGIYRDTRTTGAPGAVELSRIPGVSVDLGSLL